MRSFSYLNLKTPAFSGPYTSGRFVMKRNTLGSSPLKRNGVAALFASVFFLCSLCVQAAVDTDGDGLSDAVEVGMTQEKLNSRVGDYTKTIHYGDGSTTSVLIHGTAAPLMGKYHQGTGLLLVDADPATHTDPSKTDTDGDGYWDGPDILQNMNGQLFWRVGEDKNGNGKYEPAGEDGILGTADDEYDPNNPASHPECNFYLPYIESASWHDANCNGVPDAQEDLNLNGIYEPELGETDFLHGLPLETRCKVRYEDALALGGTFPTTATCVTNNSAITNLCPPNELANVYWYIWSGRSDFGNAVVKFTYVDADIYAGTSSALDVNKLILYRADQLSGPWIRLPNRFKIDPSSKEISARVNSFGYFAIRQEPIPSGVMAITVDPAGSIKTIQQALDSISPGGVITVNPGTYPENLVFPYWVDATHSLTLTSTNPNDLDNTYQTIIDGGGNGPAVQLYGDETSQTLIDGFVIINGNNKLNTGGGGVVGQGSKVSILNDRITFNISRYSGGGLSGCNGLIKNCLIAENSVMPDLTTKPVGGGLANCNGEICNDTIYDNEVKYSLGSSSSLGSYGGGIAGCKHSIHNCIVWGNSASDAPSSQVDKTSTMPDQCCIQNWTRGGNNSSTDPNFSCTYLGNFRVDPNALPYSVGSDGVTDSVLPDDASNYLTLSQQGSSVNLSWTNYQDKSNTSNGFNIYRAPSSYGTYSLIGSVPQSARSFTDSNPDPNESGFYVVCAAKSSGSGSGSTGAHGSGQSRSKKVARNPKIKGFAIEVYPSDQSRHLDQLICEQFEYCAVYTWQNYTTDAIRNLPDAKSGKEILDRLRTWKGKHINQLLIIGHGDEFGICGQIVNGAPTKTGMYYPCYNPTPSIAYGLSPTVGLPNTARYLDDYPNPIFLEPGHIKALSGLSGGINPVGANETFKSFLMSGGIGMFNQSSKIVLFCCSTGRNTPYNYDQYPERFLKNVNQSLNGMPNPNDPNLTIAPNADKEAYGYYEEQVSGTCEWKPTTPHVQDQNNPNVTKMEDPTKASFGQELSLITGAIVIAPSGMAEIGPRPIVYNDHPVHIPFYSTWFAAQSTPDNHEDYADQTDNNIKFAWTHNIYVRWNEKDKVGGRITRKWRVFRSGLEDMNPEAESWNAGTLGGKYLWKVNSRGEQLFRARNFFIDGPGM